MTDESDNDRASLWFIRAVLVASIILMIGIVAWLVLDPPSDDPAPDHLLGTGAVARDKTLPIGQGVPSELAVPVEMSARPAERAPLRER